MKKLSIVILLCLINGMAKAAAAVSGNCVNTYKSEAHLNDVADDEEQIPYNVDQEPHAVGFTNEDKLSNYWYKSNGYWESGYDEIHAQTPSPGTAAAESIGYARDIDYVFSDAFENNQIVPHTLVGISASEVTNDLVFSDKNNGKVYYAVYGTTGCTYTVKTAQDDGVANKALVAYQRDGKDITPETIAIIRGTEINDMRVVYQHGNASQGLLNYAAYKDLGDKVLKATVELKVKETATGKEIPCTDNTFDIRFLRPINVITTKVNISDATDSKNIIYLSDIISSITDWRDYTFSTHTNYWRYYNIKSIKVLGATSGMSINSLITTDMGGSDIETTKLSQVSSTNLFTGFYNEITSYRDINSQNLHIYGYIEYTNTSSSVQAFSVRIPVAVTYEWGTQIVYATINIKPTYGYDYPDPVKVTSVALDNRQLNEEDGSTFKLTATVLPADADVRTLTWTSSNERVATVNEAGLVTCLAPGTSVITATTIDGTNLSDACTVTVSPLYAKSIAISPVTSSSLEVGETLSLTARILPSNATYNDVAWTSSDNTVARVTDGVVTALSEGEATIFARTTDGTSLSAKCQVTVGPVNVNSIVPDHEQLLLDEDDIDAIYSLDGRQLNGVQGGMYIVKTKDGEKKVVMVKRWK